MLLPSDANLFRAYFKRLLSVFSSLQLLQLLQLQLTEKLQRLSRRFQDEEWRLQRQLNMNWLFWFDWLTWWKVTTRLITRRSRLQRRGRGGLAGSHKGRGWINIFKGPGGIICWKNPFSRVSLRCAAAKDEPWIFKRDEIKRRRRNN